MPTFAELQGQHIGCVSRKAVLEALIEYLDSNFVSVAGKPPAKMLKTEKGNFVEANIFEVEIAYMNQQVDNLAQYISQIEQAVVQVPVQQTETVANTTVAPSPEGEPTQPTEAPTPGETK